MGKSLIYENPFSSNAHQFLNADGCGKWQTGKKSMVLYHDISLSVLLRPSECEIFKTLARTEMSVSKVFAGAACLPPLWIMVTSNQRFHSHSVPEPSRELRERIRLETEEGKKGKSGSSQQLLLPSWRPSEISKFGRAARPSQQSSPAKLRRSLLLESNLKPVGAGDWPNVRAIQSRVLEAHCFQRPDLDPSCIPRGEKFTRAHVLLGAAERVLSHLEQRERGDFYSWPIASYCLTTLCMVARFYDRQMEDGAAFKSRLRAILEKLETDEDGRQIYLDLI